MRRLFAVIAAVVVSLAVAPPAPAETPDSKFDRSLAALGYQAQHPDAARALGRQMCALVDAGTSWEEILSALQGQGRAEDESVALAAASIIAYCPWNNPNRQIGVMA